MASRDTILYYAISGGVITKRDGDGVISMIVKGWIGLEVRVIPHDANSLREIEMFISRICS